MDSSSQQAALLAQREQRATEAERPLVGEELPLAVRIRRGILRLAAGRIRELEVTVRAGTILIEGRCASFYCKQLAQHAAMELAPGKQVDNRLVVAWES